MPPRLVYQFQPKAWSHDLCFHRSSTTSIRLHSKATKYALPSKPARTRFAPSPTGFLHLGSLRTALFNYLLAKSTGGQFILRIEDTDTRRTVPGAEAQICKDLSWAGLHWDEGPLVGGPHGPYRQSERTLLYRQHANQLLQSGHAYRCFCTSERLQRLAQERLKLGLPTDYDRTCASIPQDQSEERSQSGESHVIRLRVPAQYPELYDLVYGKVKNRINLNLGQPAYEDPILLKSDGLPTYHLANVVDDHHMEITHVVRAAEWMSSTPKHLYMYEAFDWKPPAYAHVGLLLDQDKQKLSKRNQDTDISYFSNVLGVLPEALVNFVALLGWSHSKGKDVMTIEQLVRNFNLKFTTGNTIVAFEKLWFLQKAHVKRRVDLGGQDLEDLVDRVAVAIDARSDVGIVPRLEDLQSETGRNYIRSLLSLDVHNYKTAKDFVERNSYMLYNSHLPDTKSIMNEHKSNSEGALTLFATAEFLDSIHPDFWCSQSIKEKLHNIEEIRIKQYSHLQLTDEVALSRKWRGEFHRLLRWAISNSKPGPIAAEVMQVLGKEETILRLMSAMEALRAS